MFLVLVSALIRDWHMTVTILGSICVFFFFYRADTCISFIEREWHCICCLLNTLSVYAGKMSKLYASLYVIFLVYGHFSLSVPVIGWMTVLFQVLKVSVTELPVVTIVHHMTLPIIFWPHHSCRSCRIEATSHLLFFLTVTDIVHMFYAPVLTDIWSFLWCCLLGVKILSHPGSHKLKGRAVC